VSSFGRLLIGLGGLLIVIGLCVLLAGRTGIPLGRLPGDINYRGKNTVFFFPITTCIVLSIVLSLVIWIVNRFIRWWWSFHQGGTETQKKAAANRKGTRDLGPFMFFCSFFRIWFSLCGSVSV